MEFVQTNIIGTLNLLDASVKYGIKLFYHISTDEVFGHIDMVGNRCRGFGSIGTIDIIDVVMISMVFVLFY
jgi:GDP-D-mannose dehydratase